MDFVLIIPAFLLILLAELGDKTQLAVISLSCRYSATHVFAGSMLGFLLVDGVSILAGGSLIAVLPLKLIEIAAGAIFIVFGIFTIFSKEEAESKIKAKTRFPLFAAFYLVAISELGDKTQVASIILAAETFRASVLIGVMLAFTILVSAAVVFGAKVLARLPRKWLKISTASLFTILGIISITSALLSIELI
jgi:putative Ca2+/H+ antiporter (TMEM165/GDT1 family)